MKPPKLKTSEYPMIQMDSLESASNSLHPLSCLWTISRLLLNKRNNLLIPLSTINLQIILLIISSLSTERAARIASNNSKHSNLVQLSKFKSPQNRASSHLLIRDPWHRKATFLKGMDLCFKIHLLKTSMTRANTLKMWLPFPKEQYQWDKVRKKLLQRLPKTISLLIQTLRW
jgi:serine/threonine protein kinase